MRRFVAMGVALAVLVTLEASCRRRKPEPAAEDDSPAAAPVPAPVAAAKPSPPPRPPIPAPAVPLRVSHLERGDRDALGYPIPKGARPVSKSKTSEVHEVPYTLESLERFFRREMGPGARVEKRAHGFRIVEDEAKGFVLVTKVGNGLPKVAVIRAPETPRRNVPAEGVPLQGGAPNLGGPGH
jgi:hypothetical protein